MFLVRLCDGELVGGWQVQMNVAEVKEVFVEKVSKEGSVSPSVS